MQDVRNIFSVSVALAYPRQVRMLLTDLHAFQYTPYASLYNWGMISSLQPLSTTDSVADHGLATGAVVSETPQHLFPHNASPLSQGTFVPMQQAQSENALDSLSDITMVEVSPSPIGHYEACGVLATAAQPQYHAHPCQSPLAAPIENNLVFASGGNPQWSPADSPSNIYSSPGFNFSQPSNEFQFYY